MFILRQITPQGVESNQILGDNYSITTEEAHKEKFDQIIKDQQLPTQYMQFAYLHHSTSPFPYPLFEGFKYYIMTGSGETFANLTCK